MKTLFVYFIMLVFISACNNDENCPELSGDYLGQDPPGSAAEIFAPGIVSTALNDRDITFHPEGNEIVYGVLEAPRSLLVSVKRVNDIWQEQEILPFCGTYNDIEPQFSPDGKRLYFCSDRPSDENDTPGDYDIWYAERNDKGWGEPVNLGAPINSNKNEFYPSVTKGGSIYFTTHDMKIFVAHPTEDGYAQPISVSDSVNSGKAEYNAFIAPDESYLIFTSHGWAGGREGRGDLFISFRKNDGSWSSSINMGSEINSDVSDMCPTVTLDGRYLFFSSRRAIEQEGVIPVKKYCEIFEIANTYGNGKFDIYWMNTDRIDSLRSTIGR